MEEVDQDDVAEEFMEAEIVSLTLDPPPATAATVLHQHHIHHHGRRDGSFTESLPDKNADDNVNSENSTPKDTEVANKNLESTIDASHSQNIDKPKTQKIDNNGPTCRPRQASSAELANQSQNEQTSCEVLPKKSSFPRLKSAINEYSGAQKVKRNVSFPNDENLVTMKVEPVDPWKSVKNTNSAEVINQYRLACKSMKTKPIDNVIKQLQDLPDLSCRIATLSLKGVKLDSKACEALEAIFRRVRFEVVDFENCSLEEEGATALLEMIEFYQSACRLNVAMNPKMGMRGWQTLCRMLRKTPCLHSLDARRTMLTDQTMPMFGRCLKADPYLRTLHLEGVYLCGRPLLILTTALKYNTFLEELYLGDNDLQPADGVSIGAMLGANRTLQLLDLRNNSFRDGGLVHIANGLVDQANFEYGGLTSIVLWNLGLTHEAMFDFSDAMAKIKTLRSLNLGQNRIGDLGLQKIKPGLLRNRSLRKLGLLNTKIGNEGAVALAEILADSVSIARIDVRENHIQIAGLMALSLAMKVNHTLVRIDLDKELRREPGLETVQQSVLADIYNFCHRNKQLARESLSRESSTSEEGEPFVVQRFPDKETKDENDRHEKEVVNDITGNPRLVSSLQTLAAINKSDKKKSVTASSPAKKHQSSTMPVAYNNSVSGKPRFTITRIIETLGHASADVANKLTGNISSASRNKDDSLSNSSRKLELKTLSRQPKVDVPNPKKTDALSSPTRDRNRELKEFYRKLKDGEIDNSQRNDNDNGPVDKNIGSSHITSDNLIEKLPFPGVAKKLNDCIDDNSLITRSVSQSNEHSENRISDSPVTESSHPQSIEFVNGSETD